MKMKQKQPSITSTAEFYETGTNIWKLQALQIDSLTTKQRCQITSTKCLRRLVQDKCIRNQQNNRNFDNKIAIFLEKCFALNLFLPV